MRTKKKILKRIQILYVIFFVIMIASIVIGVTGNDFRTGYNDAMRDSKQTELEGSSKELQTKHIFSLGNKTANRIHDITILSTPDSSTMASARVQSFDLKLISKEGSSLRSGLTITSSLLLTVAIMSYIAIFIIILIIINSLRRSVKTENIFERRNILLTRAIGILIICASICASLSLYFNSLFAAQYMANSPFTVDTSISFTFSDIIMGILILFIAEVFAIGYDVSQEQKLTI